MSMSVSVHTTSKEDPKFTAEAGRFSSGTEDEFISLEIAAQGIGGVTFFVEPDRYDDLKTALLQCLEAEPRVYR